MWCWHLYGTNVRERTEKFRFGSVLSDIELPKIIYFGPDVTEDEIVEMYELSYPQELVFVPLRSQNEGYNKVLKTVERMVVEYDFPVRLILAYGDELCDGVIHLRAFSEINPSIENEIFFYKMIPGLEEHLRRVYSRLIETRSISGYDEIEELDSQDCYTDKENFIVPNLRVNHSGPIEVVYGDTIDLFQKGYVPLGGSVSAGNLEEIPNLIKGFKESHGDFLAALGVEKIEGSANVLVSPYELLPDRKEPESAGNLENGGNLYQQKK